MRRVHKYFLMSTTAMALLGACAPASVPQNYTICDDSIEVCGNNTAEVIIVEDQ
jgi:hypothetical protein